MDSLEILAVSVETAKSNLTINATNIYVYECICHPFQVIKRGVCRGLPCKHKAKAVLKKKVFIPNITFIVTYKILHLLSSKLEINLSKKKFPL